MFSRHVRLGFLVLSTVFWVSACDSLSGPDDSGLPLWSVTGTVSLGDEALVVNNPNLRAAIIWETESETNGSDRFVQDIPLEAQFPLNFSLDIYDLPPESAIETFNYGDWCLDGLRIAIGFVVVYNDGDDDGELDFADVGDTEFVDTILGTSAYSDRGVEIFLIYVDSDEEVICEDGDTGYEVFQPGLNIYFETIGYTGDNSGPQSPETSMEFELSDSHLVQSLACYEMEGSGIEVRTVEVSTGDVPSNIDVYYRCIEDDELGNYVIDWTAETSWELVDGDVCSLVGYENFYTSTSPMDEPPPAHWPCEFE